MREDGLSSLKGHYSDCGWGRWISNVLLCLVVDPILVPIAVLDERKSRFVWVIVFQKQQIGDRDTALGDNSLFHACVE